MRRRVVIGLVILTVGLGVIGAIAWLLRWGDRFGGDRVAVVSVDGVIADSQRVVDQIGRYQRNPAVKALVVRIDSPGGAVAPSQEIHGALVKFRKETGRPVVASMGRVAASGGYYVAVAADRIVANPGTITGSIGVILQLPNVAGLLQKVGIKTTIVKAGELKDLGGTVRDLTDAERKVLQDMIDDVHAQFIDAVTAGRKSDRAKIVLLADGRVYSGRQAVAAGLVDELGDLQDALSRAATMAGLPAGRPAVLQERRRSSLWDLLAGITEGLDRARTITFPTASLDYLWTAR